MVISKTSNEELKITLNNTEVINRFGNYAGLYKMDGKTKLKLKNLLVNILKIKRNALLNEVSVELKVMENKGMIIKIKFIKTRSKPKVFLFAFEDTEALIKGAYFLNHNPNFKGIKSYLYKMPEGYRLLVLTTKDFNDFTCLKEFCIGGSDNITRVAYTREYGKELIGENAVEILGKIFKEP